MAHQKSIIIIDDDQEHYSTLSPLLLDQGFVITEAGTAREALSRLIDNRYDLAFLDIQLPDRAGINLLPDIHLLDPEMPIMIVSSNASLEDAVDALRKGAREYILKPIDPKKIIARIEEVLRDRV